METLQTLSIILLAAWCLSEITISLVSLGNRSRTTSVGGDRYSYFIVWFSTVFPIFLAFLIRKHLLLPNGFGSLASLFPFPGYVGLGCLVLLLGITVRLAAAVTLRKQFTEKVSILEEHELVDTGIYGIIRHPAYLGHLMSLLGIGLILGNWVGMAVLVLLPLAAILYRIQVEERALLGHFGPAYQEYAGRTKRLLPGIW
jgi:protein-S-isoprenylcysteine O-methyltransferase Ste14